MAGICSFEGHEDGIGCLLSENCLAEKCFTAPCSHRTDGMSYERQSGGLWNMMDTIKTMYHIIKEKWYCMPAFKSYCAASECKIPCEVILNEFWACGLDMQVLRSLDPRL